MLWSKESSSLICQPKSIDIHLYSFASLIPGGKVLCSKYVAKENVEHFMYSVCSNQANAIIIIAKAYKSEYKLRHVKLKNSPDDDINTFIDELTTS